MKNKGMAVFLVIILAAVMYFGYNTFTQREYVVMGSEKTDYPDEWNKIIADGVNATAIVVNVRGKKYNSTATDMYMSDDMELMCSTNVVSEMFECAANVFDNNTLKITD